MDILLVGPDATKVMILSDAGGSTAINNVNLTFEDSAAGTLPDFTQIQSGTYQVGAVNFQVWERELKEGKIDPKRVSVIWRTPPYPDYQWTVRGDVDQRFGAGFKARLKQTFLDLRDPQVLAAFPRTRFIPANNADYAPIVEVGKQIGLLD